MREGEMWGHKQHCLKSPLIDASRKRVNRYTPSVIWAHRSCFGLVQIVSSSALVFPVVVISFALPCVPPFWIECLWLTVFVTEPWYNHGVHTITVWDKYMHHYNPSVYIVTFSQLIEHTSLCYSHQICINHTTIFKW